jgi:integral membrane protein (TIGR01906 family)
MNKSLTLIKAGNVFVTILTPLTILMLSIRLLITPFFAQIEYHMPGFPEDPFGFSLKDRLTWSDPSIRYLVNSEGITFLEELRFEDGEPIFNERELSHMQDVKKVVTGMRFAMMGAILMLVVITVLAIKGGWQRSLLIAYVRGAWLLIGLIIAILIFVSLNFENLFTWFHQIFFESGTWRFYTSDTLIRLFPMRFWRDAFIFVGGLSALLSGLMILLLRKRII